VLHFPDIDPVLIRIGDLAIRWYAVTHVAGFAVTWWLGWIRLKRPESRWTHAEFVDLLFFVIVGILLGGRWGFLLFYEPSSVLADPLALVRIWEPGLSFHGGLLGALLGGWLFVGMTGRGFLDAADFLCPLAPIGLGLGRIGNFVNGELWGRPTDLPWGMVFPHVDSQPRHPSMLYESLLEGPVLFAILWMYSARRRPPGAVLAMFLLWYGLFRFAVEFVREPDAHLGFVAWGWVTMGHALTLPMIVVGLAMLAWAYQSTQAT